MPRRNKLLVTRAVKEIGSGLNGRRRKLLALLKDAKIGTIIVEHRDRLARFGAEFMETALAASGRKAPRKEVRQEPGRAGA